MLVRWHLLGTLPSTEIILNDPHFIPGPLADLLEALFLPLATLLVLPGMDTWISTEPFELCLALEPTSPMVLVLLLALETTSAMVLALLLSLRELFVGEARVL